MKKLFYLLTFFLFLGSALWLTSCGSGGTETRNPTNEEDGTGDEPIASSTVLASVQIRDALCTKLVECFTALKLSDCESGVELSSDVHAEIGFEQNDYDTFNEVIDDEEAENISADADPLTNCVDDIELLECSDSSLESAFDENNPDNFNNIGSMVPDGSDSCEGIF